MDSVTKMSPESVQTATVLDRHRERQFAVHEPTLILKTAMGNENGRRAAVNKGAGRRKK